MPWLAAPGRRGIPRPRCGSWRAMPSHLKRAPQACAKVVELRRAALRQRRTTSARACALRLTERRLGWLRSPSRSVQPQPGPRPFPGRHLPSRETWRRAFGLAAVLALQGAQINDIGKAPRIGIDRIDVVL